MDDMADRVLRRQGPTRESGSSKPPLAAVAPVAAVAVITVVLATFATVGADARWLVALGEYIATSGRIPVGVPFATADSSSWANVPVLGELAFYGINSVAGWGLPAGLVLASGTLLVLLALEARSSGAGPSSSL